MKYDSNKPPLHLIPPEALLKIANVFSFGAEKYGENNWRDDGDSTSWTRTYASIQRHLNAWAMGQDYDSESGQEHLAHATTQLIILMIHQLEHPDIDDRYNTTRINFED
tara:strand:+ start:188 stop:514 length:327 start_codon:yes stop_codon:yes gene_type:complete